jgi:hypothetical protein
MSTKSLNRLSDYFAEIVHNKILSKSSAELLTTETRARKFLDTFKTQQVLKAAKAKDEILDKDILDFVEDRYEDRLELTTIGWHSEEDCMKCIFAQLLPRSTNTTWLLVYRICFEEIGMIFECQVDTEEVCNYVLKVFQGDCDDYWNYYFNRSSSTLA